MTNIELSLKAIELLKDWSTWMVGIQTGAIAVIGSLTASTKEALTEHHPVSRWAVFSLVSFATSIFSAAWLLASLPSITMRLSRFHPDDSINIYGMSLFEFLPIPLWVVIILEHLWFVIGIWCFIALVFFRVGGKVEVAK